MIVLRHFERQGYITNGLTIPYLIGSSSVLTSCGELSTVTDFLQEACSDPCSFQITLMYCNYIGEYVVGTLDRESVSSTPYYQNIGGIFVTDSSLSWCSSLKELTELLENEYACLISERKFSTEGGVWVEFSEKDKEQIKEAFNQSHRHE
jgi:hypothetical protein